jgi:hypothetical protein
MPSAKIDLAACAIGSFIYVFGGFSGLPLTSVFRFDTEANVWSTLALMPHVCSYHSASVLGDLMYIVGAGSGRGVLCCDPASGAWSALAPASSSRQGGASFVVGGCLYAAGGVIQSSVASNTWTAVIDMLEGRHHFGAVTFESPAEEQDLFDSLIAKASSGRP